MTVQTDTAYPLRVGTRFQPMYTALTLHRLILHASGNRDFTNLHYDDVAAQRAGARGAFINNVFAFGLWERILREALGPRAIIHSISGLRMSAFNVVGDELVTEAVVTSLRESERARLISVELTTTNTSLGKVTIGPGTAVVSVPGDDQAPSPDEVVERYRIGAADFPESASGPEDDLDDPQWQAVAAMRGQNLLSHGPVYGADAVDRSVIRRLCEPLELGSPIHFSENAARSAGFDKVVAPIFGMGTSYVDPGSWLPGEQTQYPIAERDAEPVRSNGVETGASMVPLPYPKGSIAILTNASLHLHAPIYEGDHLRVSSVQLARVIPKRTAVGAGAFLTFVNEVWAGDRHVGTVTKVQLQYVPESP